VVADACLAPLYANCFGSRAVLLTHIVYYGVGVLPCMVASGARVDAHLTAILVVVVSADNSLHQTETLRENSGVGFLDDLRKLT
jgi:hypothetical protein